MRVAIVTPILPTKQDITRGRFIHETIKSLSGQATLKVFLLQARYPQWGKPNQRNKHLALSSGDILPCSAPVTPVTYPALPLVSRLINASVAAGKVCNHIADFRPDIIIGYWAYPEGAAAVKVGAALRIPAIIGALGTDINDRQGVQRLLTGNALRSADHTIFVSKSMKQFAQSSYKLPAYKCSTVTNGVNTAVFHPQNRAQCKNQIGISPETRLIVFVGRLIEAKGLDELFEAFSIIHAKRKDVLCVVIGRGEMEAKLKQRSAAPDLNGQFVLTGGLSPSEIATYINAADVLTLPSWSEGYPNVLVEALACGCPVVASTVGGIPEIVHKHNGILVPAKNPAALAEGLVKALDHPWNRLEIARKMNRTWSDVAAETLQICDRVIRARSS